jgi:hypothetical protein
MSYLHPCIRGRVHFVTWMLPDTPGHKICTRRSAAGRNRPGSLEVPLPWVCHPPGLSPITWKGETWNLEPMTVTPTSRNVPIRPVTSLLLPQPQPSPPWLQQIPGHRSRHLMPPNYSLPVKIPKSESLGATTTMLAPNNDYPACYPIPPPTPLPPHSGGGCDQVVLIISSKCVCTASKLRATGSTRNMAA